MNSITTIHVNGRNHINRPDPTALDEFKECNGHEETDPLERLRFFCSLAMTGQDWLDVEPFFDAVSKAMKEKST